MTYSKATTYDSKSAMSAASANEDQNFGGKVRSYLAPVGATLILGALLVGDMALRCYPYWS